MPASIIANTDEIGFGPDFEEVKKYKRKVYHACAMAPLTTIFQYQNVKHIFVLGVVSGDGSVDDHCTSLKIQVRARNVSRHVIAAWMSNQL